MTLCPIPNGETLFRFVKPQALPHDQKEVPPGLFNDADLSCDWKKFREDPTTSFHIVQGKTWVIGINVCQEIKDVENPKRSGQIVPDWKQEVLHAPVTADEDPVNGENAAHSVIRGKKKGAVIDAIARNSEFLIKLPI